MPPLNIYWPPVHKVIKTLKMLEYVFVCLTEGEKMKEREQDWMRNIPPRVILIWRKYKNEQ